MLWCSVLFQLDLPVNLLEDAEKQLQQIPENIFHIIYGLAW
jgi:hypothetical protein